MAQDSFDIPDFPKGIYRHYKGGLYEVIDVACHSETLEWYVVYRHLKHEDGVPDTWIRPLTMFTEDIEVDGVRLPRFQKLDSLA